MKATDSVGVLNIFQLAAIKGLRIVVVILRCYLNEVA